MSLSSYKPLKMSVPLPGSDSGNLIVRGLNFSDIVYLMHEEREEVEKVIDLFKSGAKDVDKPADVQNVVKSVARNSPGLIATVIAVACDEPDQKETASQLPLPKQLEIISAVASLTFTEAGGVKKFLDLVIQAITSTTRELQTLTPPTSATTHKK